MTDVDEDTLVLWAMSVEQYSRLLLRIGQYKAARQHLQQALDVCLKIHGDSHLQTAVLRNDVGQRLILLRFRLYIRDEQDFSHFDLDTY